MKRNKLPEHKFPMETFLQVQQEMLEAQRKLKKEKAEWALIRNAVPAADHFELDEQFRETFQRVGHLLLSSEPKKLEPLKQSLKALIDRGASAATLDPSEMGPYNVAMLIDNIVYVTEASELENVAEIIRMAVVAGADLTKQKTYVGNGGAISIDYLSHLLGLGLSSDYKLKNRQQYECCYKIFSWIVSAPVERWNPLNNFLISLKVSDVVTDLQEKVLLAMIGLGFSPFLKDEQWQYDRFFTHLWELGERWSSLLYPYEEEVLNPYINAFRPNITADIARKIINSFTGDNKSRKYFRNYFSLRPHWLLQCIIESAPQLIFDLVKRNEQDMLAPFLKNFKQALLTLRDEKGNTLLHQAAMSRGFMENTIQLLRNAGFSLQAVNGDGITPLALAQKYKRTELVKWLN
jgi:hypothetical protein